MEETEIESTIRTLFADLKQDKVRSLLVQCADWGINVRMFLNDETVELDLIKNYEGYEVTFVDAPAKTPAQIDDLSDLIQLLQISRGRLKLSWRKITSCGSSRSSGAERHLSARWHGLEALLV